MDQHGRNSIVRAGLIYELQNVASGFREWQAKLRFGGQEFSPAAAFASLFAAFFIYYQFLGGRGSDAAVILFLLPIAAPVDREYASLPGARLWFGVRRRWSNDQQYTARRKRRCVMSRNKWSRSAFLLSRIGHIGFT